MVRSFAIVKSREPDCPDTLRAMKFFSTLSQAVVVEEVAQDSLRAIALWAGAYNKGGLNKFQFRLDEGHPLVVVLEGDKVLWACCEPSTIQLRRALAIVVAENQS